MRRESTYRVEYRGCVRVGVRVGEWVCACGCACGWVGGCACGWGRDFKFVATAELHSTEGFPHDVAACMMY